MLILTMMGLTPGLLVHALFLFALTILLVTFVAWVLTFPPNRIWVQLWHCYVGSVCTKKTGFQRWSTHRNIFAPKVLIFPPDFKISFIAIVLVWSSCTHSDCCCFAKDMIWWIPMESIRRNSDPGNGGTEDNKFIWCVDGQGTQIHKLWCLSLVNVTRKVHLTVHVEVGAGPVGEFTTNYLARNGHRITIIGQLSINRSVQFLGIPDFVRGSGFSFIPSLQATTDTTGLWHGVTFNNNWIVSPGGPYSNTSVAWGTTVSAYLA